MIYMHCQVRFEDFDRWKASMDADAAAQHAAGIHLKQMWRGIENPNIAFFVLEVDDMDRAREFLAPDAVAKAEAEAGASDFQYFFVERIELHQVA